jgi:hypothetical protein
VKIRVVSTAKRELFAASDFYDRRRPGLGTEFLNDVENALALIRDYPQAWPVKYTKGIRQIGLQRFPYAIIYRLLANDAVILAVAHLHRRPAYWKSRTGGD